jgi:hypothetical protein
MIAVVVEPHLARPGGAMGEARREVTGRHAVDQEADHALVEVRVERAVLK